MISVIFFNTFKIEIFTFLNIYNFKVYNSVVFGIFTRLYSHHYLIPEHFITPVGNPISISIHSALAPFPLPLTTTNLFCVCMELPNLDISYRWIHIICDLWIRFVLFSMFSRCIQVVACVCTSFLFSLNHCIYGYATSFLSIHKLMAFVFLLFGYCE